MTINFTLFSFDEQLVEHWRESFAELVPDEVKQRVSFVHSKFEDLKSQFDCIVSPANSFGRFDGGEFDQVLTEALAPMSDQSALTRTAQHVIY
ncbi:hypothetical protein ACG7TL_001795 [Trametes sanguinea]